MKQRATPAIRYESTHATRLEPKPVTVLLVETPPRVLVVRLRNVLAIDASGPRELELLHGDGARRGTALVLSGVHAQPLVALERSGLLERIGGDSVCPTSTRRSHGPAS